MVQDTSGKDRQGTTEAVQNGQKVFQLCQTVQKDRRAVCENQASAERFPAQMACRLARAYDVIAVEDLNMAAMKKSLNFGRSVSDNAWGTFLTILEGQCKKYGHMLLFVSKWFPSTKTCLSCGYIHKEITLKDRTYICPSCGHVMDRDYQAAVNLREEALRIISENIAQIKRIAT